MLLVKQDHVNMTPQTLLPKQSTQKERARQLIEHMNSMLEPNEKKTSTNKEQTENWTSRSFRCYKATEHHLQKSLCEAGNREPPENPL